MTPSVATRGDGSLLRFVHRASEDRVWLSLGLAFALLLHAAAAFSAREFLHRPPAAPTIDASTELTEVELPKAPPPAAPEPPKPEETPSPKPLTTPAQAGAPPPAAQAAAVLTRAPDSNEPVDLTDGFVSGSAATYAGGQTSASGTSTSAVHTPPAVAGVVGGTGKPDAPGTQSGPDLSRRPGVTGGAEWRCPFPPEADAEQIDHAVVTIKIEVDRFGRAMSATATKESGSGFGREARRCALQQRWSPALDRNGTAVQGSTTVNVRFNR